MRVEVYWNLHKHVWSVRSCKTGRVIAHAERVVLRDVSWTVQPAGNRRVRETGRKNVHAFGRGTLAALDGVMWQRLDVPVPKAIDAGARGRLEPVRYNPYIHTTFVVFEDTPIRASWGASFAVKRTDSGGRRPAAWAVCCPAEMRLLRGREEAA
jgi:hypothetical protein